MTKKREPQPRASARANSPAAADAPPAPAVHDTHSPSGSAAGPSIRPPGRVVVGDGRNHQEVTPEPAGDGRARLRKLLEFNKGGTQALCKAALDEILRLMQTERWKASFDRWKRLPRATPVTPMSDEARAAPIRPPGRVIAGGHGPQSADPAVTHAGKLRAFMELSPTCALDQVLEEAANLIQHLRKPKEPGIHLPFHDSAKDAL